MTDNEKIFANITNLSTNTVYISSDPNWDDQKLYIDGHLVKDNFSLLPNNQCKITFYVGGVGIIISNTQNPDAQGSSFIQTSFDLDQSSGKVAMDDDPSIFGNCTITTTSADSSQISCTVKIIS